MFRQFVENRIRKQGNGYYCNLCENFLQTKENALTHIDSTNVYHNTLKRAQFNEPKYKLPDLSERHLETLVDNYILQISRSEYRCHICNCVMHPVGNVFKHIKKAEHVREIKKQPNEVFDGRSYAKNINLEKVTNVSAEGESLDCKLCKVRIESEKCLIQHQQGKMHKLNAEKEREKSQENVSEFDPWTTCNPNSETNSNTKYDVDSMSFGRSSKPAPNISNLPVYTCFLCDITFHDTNTIIQHFKAPDNGCSISSLLKPNELVQGVFSCGLCLNNISNDVVCLIQHTQGKKHRNNAKREKEKSQQNVSEDDPMTTCNPTLDCNSNTERDIVTVCNSKAHEPVKNIFSLPVYKCFLCDSTFSDYGTTVQHFTEPDNGCTISSLLKSEKLDNKILRCGLCLMNVSNSNACLLEHTQGKNHKYNAEKEREKSQKNFSECVSKPKCNPILECDVSTKHGAVAVCNRKAEEPVKSIFSLPVYICFLCDSTFPDYGTAVQHFTELGNGCLISSLLKPKTNILNCELCLMNVPNSEACLLEHTQGKNHKYNTEKEREKSRGKAKAVKPTQNICSLPPYTCFICKGTFSDKDTIAQHFFESKQSCTAPSFIKKHSIVDNKVIFSCGLCCTSLLKSFNDLLLHTQGKRHKTNTIRAGENSQLKYSSCNSLTKGTCNADCKPIEKCGGNGRQRVQDVSSLSAFTCVFCESNFSDKDIIVQHFFQPVNGCRASSFLKRTIVNNKTVFSCMLCHICAFETFDFILHTQGKVHKINCEEKRKILGFGISKKKSEPKHNLKENNVYKKDISTILMNISNIDISYYCNICNFTAGSDLKLFKHLNELQHMNLISKLPKDSKPFIYCPACKVQISEDEAIMNHLDSSEHKRKLFILFANSDNSKYSETCINSVSEPITKVKNQTSKIQNKPSRKSRKPKIEERNQNTHFAQNKEFSKNKSLINVTNVNLLYKCYVCNTTIDGDLQLLDHLNDRKHKNSLSILPRDFVPYIYCPFCKSDIFEDEGMISHLESDGHKTRLSDLSVKSDSKIGNLNQNHVDLQINLVSGSNAILDELCSEMIRKPRKPKPELKNKNKFTPHFSEEYSRMFLEMGPSNIFNVDQRKMETLNSGIALSFLLNDERLCLVCNQRMPNSLQVLYEHLLNVDHIYKLDQLAINDLEFEHFRDQFSDLALAKEFLIEVNDDAAFCFPCKVEIKNDDNAIKNHVENDTNHRVKSRKQKELTEDIFKKFTEQLNNLWYIVQRFWCQVCNAKFEYDIDFAEHIEGKKHVREVKKLLSKGMKICCDACIPCASMSMGLPDTYTKHCEDNMHKYLVKSKDYAVPEMIKPAMNLLNNVEETAESLVLESNAAQFVEKKIGLVLKCLEEIVKSHYPEAKAYVFGSRGSYLAFCDSDVDIFLDCGNAYNGTQLLSKTREYLLNSQICFESQPDEWDLKEVLLKVRAPIIRVRHRELGLNCDVSFTSGLTVEKTKIVRLFMVSYPPCRKMVLYLKKWLNTCLLTDSQGLTTFGITWLVIFYLQQIKILPSIAELMKNKSQSKIIAGWETGINEKIPIKHCSLKFRELLRGFFEFYANYNYRSCVVSPLMGKSLRKQDFTDNYIAHLPSEMESYSRFIKLTPKPEIYRIDSPLCLQDPIDLVQNITRSVSKFILRCFIQYCRTSAEKLSN